MAAYARVCAYDRPGSARIDDTFTPSTPIPQPTTPRNAAADLHALLTAAGVPGQYVLAGWSMGGPIARVYAGTHPSDVSGLVLVDGTLEYLQAELTPTEAQTSSMQTPSVPADAPPDYPEVFWRAQLASQNALAGLFLRVEHIADTNSEHNIHDQSPGLIVGAIHDVVAVAEES